MKPFFLMYNPYKFWGKITSHWIVKTVVLEEKYVDIVVLVGEMWLWDILKANITILIFSIIMNKIVTYVSTKSLIMSVVLNNLLSCCPLGEKNVFTPLLLAHTPTNWNTTENLIMCIFLSVQPMYELLLRALCWTAAAAAVVCQWCLVNFSGELRTLLLSRLSAPTLQETCRRVTRWRTLWSQSDKCRW